MQGTWPEGFRNIMKFASQEVFARRDDMSTERKAGELATDWAVNGGTRVYAGLRGESVHVAEVPIQNGGLVELPIIGHLNFVTGSGMQQNLLTVDGEVWRVEPGQQHGQQLPDDAIDALIERAAVK